MTMTMTIADDYDDDYRDDYDVSTHRLSGVSCGGECCVYPPLQFLTLLA